MSENRFRKGDWTNCRYDICEIVTDDDEIICVVSLNDADKIIGLLEENEQLLKENVFLAKQRNYWKSKRDMAVETFEIDEATVKQIRKLEKENEQLQGKVKRLNAFIVSKDLAIEYLKWNKEGDNDE